MAKSPKKTKKNKQLPLIIAAVVIAAGAIAAMVIPGGGKSASGVQTVSAGGSLTIPENSVGEEASFYPVEVDGVSMEVLAIRDSEGNIRTAFNTCQSCHTSGRGYYKAEGTELICQNCGFHFTAEQVETPAGGCNPYPIFEENKTVENGEIQIGYEFLKESSGIFANWRG